MRPRTLFWLAALPCAVLAIAVADPGARPVEALDSERLERAQAWQETGALPLRHHHRAERDRSGLHRRDRSGSAPGRLRQDREPRGHAQGGRRAPPLRLFARPGAPGRAGHLLEPGQGLRHRTRPKDGGAQGGRRPAGRGQRLRRAARRHGHGREVPRPDDRRGHRHDAAGRRRRDQRPTGAFKRHFGPGPVRARRTGADVHVRLRSASQSNRGISSTFGPPATCGAGIDPVASATRSQSGTSGGRK